MLYMSRTRLYDHLLVSIVVSHSYFIVQVKQVLHLYYDMVSIMWHSQNKDLCNGSKFSSVLFCSILVGLIALFLIMSVNVKGSWRMFVSLMLLSPVML
jgi:hypothetical protein